MKNCRKQSDTAFPLFFFMVDSTDHITGKTGLSPTVTISKNGGSYASPAGAASEVGNGLYKIAGNATDSNTLGELWIHATASGADPTDVAYVIVPYEVTSVINANSTQIGGTTQTGRDLGASVLLSVGTGTGQVNLSSGAVPVTGDLTATMKISVTTAATAATPTATISTGTGAGQLDITSGVVKSNLVQILATAITETVPGYLAAGFKKLLDVATPVFTLASVNQTGDNYARIGAPAGASVSADIASAKSDTSAIKTKTDFLPSATAGSAGGLFIAGTNAATTIATGLTTTLVGNVSGDVTGTVGGVFGVTFPATVASPTNITAGTITTVTNLTNAPSNGDFTAAMKASLATAVEQIPVDGTLDLQQVLKIMLAALGGTCSGSGTGTNTYYAPDGTTPRIAATIDGSKNRTAVALTP